VHRLNIVRLIQQLISVYATKDITMILITPTAHVVNAIIYVKHVMVQIQINVFLVLPLTLTEVSHLLQRLVIV